MSLNLGMLILRVVLGVVFIGHGGQKLFGWFGGGGLKGTSAWIGSMGMRPAWFWGLLAALSEFGGGVLTLLGLLNPLGPLGIAAAMLIAIVKVHLSKGFWASKGGYEFPVMNLAAALTVGLVGVGAYSLDGLLGFALPEPASTGVGIVLVVLGSIVALASESVKPVHVAQPGH
ncbi:MAG: DoxX family protein [Chloroflexi bacterium]|nr:DoxX family protein [Chloroflexota bacterium]